MIIAANSGWDEMSLQGVFILGITVLALTTGCVRDVERRQVEVLLNIFHSILKLPHTVHLLIPLNQSTISPLSWGTLAAGPYETNSLGKTKKISGKTSVHLLWWCCLLPLPASSTAACVDKPHHKLSFSPFIASPTELPLVATTLLTPSRYIHTESLQSSWDEPCSWDTPLFLSHLSCQVIIEKSFSLSCSFSSPLAS